MPLKHQETRTHNFRDIDHLWPRRPRLPTRRAPPRASPSYAPGATIVTTTLLSTPASPTRPTGMASSVTAPPNTTPLIPVCVTLLLQRILTVLRAFTPTTSPLTGSQP